MVSTIIFNELLHRKMPPSPHTAPKRFVYGLNSSAASPMFPFKKAPRYISPQLSLSLPSLEHSVGEPIKGRSPASQKFS